MPYVVRKQETRKSPGRRHQRPCDYSMDWKKQEALAESMVLVVGTLFSYFGIAMSAVTAERYIGFKRRLREFNISPMPPQIPVASDLQRIVVTRRRLR